MSEELSELLRSLWWLGPVGWYLMALPVSKKIVKKNWWDQTKNPTDLRVEMCLARAAFWLFSPIMFPGTLLVRIGGYLLSDKGQPEETKPPVLHPQDMIDTALMDILRGMDKKLDEMVEAGDAEWNKMVKASDLIIRTESKWIALTNDISTLTIAVREARGKTEKLDSFVREWATADQEVYRNLKAMAERDPTRWCDLSLYITEMHKTLNRLSEEAQGNAQYLKDLGQSLPDKIAEELNRGRLPTDVRTVGGHVVAVPEKDQLIGKLTKQVMGLETVLITKDQQITELHKQVQVLEIGAIAKDTEITNQQNALESKDRQISNLRGALEEKGNEIAYLQQQLALSSSRKQAEGRKFDATCYGELVKEGSDFVEAFLRFEKEVADRSAKKVYDDSEWAKDEQVIAATIRKILDEGKR